MKKKIMMTMGLAAALIVTGWKPRRKLKQFRQKRPGRQKLSRKQKPAQARTHLSLHRIPRQPELKNMRAATDGVFPMTARISN